MTALIGPLLAAVLAAPAMILAINRLPAREFPDLDEATIHGSRIAKRGQVGLILVTLAMGVAVGTSTVPMIDAVTITLVCCILIVIAVIDMRLLLVPDRLTLPVIWAGLLYTTVGGPVSTSDAVYGAALGYLSLYIVAYVFWLATRMEGLGMGDMKLMALIGAWGGWQVVPGTIMIAAVAGMLFGVVTLAGRKGGHKTPMPFAPFLCSAGALMLLYGEPINMAYLRFVGM